MHTTLSKYIATCSVTMLAAMSFGSQAWAVAPTPDEAGKSDAQRIDVLDVPSFLIMDLYRAEDVEPWLRRGLTLSLYWDRDWLLNQAQGQYDGSNSGLGFSLTYDINKYSAWRIGYTYSKAKYKSKYFVIEDEDDFKMTRQYLNFDYVWNLSNFYGGFNPYRKNEFLLTVGALGGTSVADDTESQLSVYDMKNPATITKHYYYGGHMGLQWRMNVTNRASFFLEPQIALISDHFDAMHNYTSMDPDFNVNAGLNYRLSGQYMKTSMRVDSVDNQSFNPFVQMFVGVNRIVTPNDALNGSLVGQSYTPIRGSFGFSVGNWFAKSMGARLSYFENVTGYGKVTKENDPSKDQNIAHMMSKGGRAELVFNPIAFFSDSTSFGRIGWDLSVGVEGGIIKKKHPNYTKTILDTKRYLGITAGTQLKYFVNKNVAYFVEARLSNPTFDLSVDEYEAANNFATEAGIEKLTNKHVSESLFTGSAGIELYTSVFNRYKRFSNPRDNHEADSVGLLHGNRLFFELGGGASHSLNRGDQFLQNMDGVVSVGVGDRIDDLHGVRLRYNLYRLRENKGGATTKSKLNKVSLDYIFDLTNFWMGADDETRHFALRPFIGATYQTADNESSLGAEFGADLAYRLSPSLELFLEPRFDYMQKYQDRWNFMAGVTYVRNQERQHTSEGNEMEEQEGNWFYEVGLGLGREFDGDEFDFPAGMMSVGRRINAISSARLRAMASWNKFLHTEDGHEKRAELDLDYMLNLSNLWAGVNPFRRNEFYVYAGPAMEVENITSKKYWFKSVWGVEAGAQYNRRISDNLSVFVEPRYHLSLIEKENRFDVFGGLVVYNKKNAAERGRTPLDYEEKSKLFVQIAGGLVHPTSWNTGGYMNTLNLPAFSAGLGYKINKLSSLRVHGDLTTNRGYKGVDGHHYIADAGFDYMFNLTNALMGENDYRRVDLELLAGPTVQVLGMSGGFKYLTLSTPTNSWELGALLNYHINSSWDLYLEPRYEYFGKNYPKVGKRKYPKFNNRYMGYLGIAYHFDKHSEWDVKQNSAVSVQIDSKTGTSHDLTRLYTQVLYGGQIGALKHTQNTKVGFYGKKRWFDLDYRLGYQLTNVFSVRGGIFSERLRTEDKNSSGKYASHEQYFGVRAEGVLNLIQLFNREYDSYENRFNWNLSAGLHMGRVTSDQPKSRGRDIGVTGGTQLQYRVVNNNWAVLELRAQEIYTKGYNFPVTAQVGVQHSFYGSEGSHDLGSNLYVQAGLGAFNAKGLGYEAAIGYDFTDLHGARLIGSYCKNTYLPTATEVNKNKNAWISLGADYVFNVTNAFYGHDDEFRHVDFLAFVGPEVTLRGADAEGKPSEMGNFFSKKDKRYLGFNIGGQLDWHITKAFSLYAEPRFSWVSKKSNLSQHSEYHFNLFSDFGLKYRIPTKKN